MREANSSSHTAVEQADADVLHCCISPGKRFQRVESMETAGCHSREEQQKSQLSAITEKGRTEVPSHTGHSKGTLTAEQ